RLRLALQASPRLFAADPRPEQLDRDRAVEQRVSRLEDDAHAAAADPPPDLEMAQPRDFAGIAAADGQCHPLIRFGPARACPRLPRHHPENIRGRRWRREGGTTFTKAPGPRCQREMWGGC